MELCRGTGLQFTGAGRSRESVRPDCERNHGTIERKRYNTSLNIPVRGTGDWGRDEEVIQICGGDVDRGKNE